MLTMAGRRNSVDQWTNHASGRMATSTTRRRVTLATISSHVKSIAGSNNNAASTTTVKKMQQWIMAPQDDGSTEDIDYEADAANEDDEEDDEWEDLRKKDDQEGSWTLFRNAMFPEEDDETESEYVPSDTESMSEEPISDLEEEDQSVLGLLRTGRAARGATKRNSLGTIKEKDGSVSKEACAFTEEDAQLWGTPEEKQQWIHKYRAADRAFMEQYGCRIDSGAHPDAKARLRREQKHQRAYKVILMAIAAAYLAQLIAMYAPSFSNVSVTNWTSKLSVEQLLEDSLPSVLIPYLVPGIPRRSLHEDLKQNDAANKQQQGEGGFPRESEPNNSDRHLSLDSSYDTVAQTNDHNIRDSVTESFAARNQGIEAVHTTEERSEEPNLVDPKSTNSDVEDSAASMSEITEDEAVQEDVTKQQEGRTATSDSSVTSEANNPVGGSSTEKLPDMASYLKAGIELCSKLSARLVKSKHDEAVKGTAIRACDVAVALAPHDTMEWIEVHVLRGDLWSLISDFDAADKDYNTATTDNTLLANNPDLRDSIQLKILSNRWIKHYVSKSFHDLRSECTTAVETLPASAVAARELAQEWLRVFTGETKVLDVLTRSRSSTLQKLQYDI